MFLAMLIYFIQNSPLRTQYTALNSQEANLITFLFHK